MSREIDVKALVSHLVRGDGADKCRICMGDTSDGQVYLGDTVMMDGERPVTLAELLEVITGVEVEEDVGLPLGLCRDCAESALAAINFRQACKDSLQQWTEAATFLASVVPPQQKDKAYYIFYNVENRIIVSDQAAKADDKQKALARLNARFQEEREDEVVEHKKIRRTKVSWYCPDCNKKFLTPQYLNLHLRNTSKRACENCGLVVKKAKLHQHLRSMHGIMVYSCSLCQEIYDDRLSLETHLELAHGPNTHQCKICGCGFTNERALGAHTYVHSLFLCNHCGACFENKKCYLYHQKQCKQSASSVVAKSDPQHNKYVCDHCGNWYTKKPSLRVHIIQKHLNVLPHVCATCGKRTSTIAHLRSHEKVHLLERKIIQCFCGAKMRTQLGYQLHMRIHSGEKPYQCEECGDKFLSASRRLDHVKRRHRSAKEMPHGCTECPARFVRPFELRKHCMTVHTHSFPYVKADDKQVHV